MGRAAKPVAPPSRLRVKLEKKMYDSKYSVSTGKLYCLSGAEINAMARLVYVSLPPCESTAMGELRAAYARTVNWKMWCALGADDSTGQRTVMPVGPRIFPPHVTPTWASREELRAFQLWQHGVLDEAYWDTRRRNGDDEWATSCWAARDALRQENQEAIWAEEAKFLKR